MNFGNNNEQPPKKGEEPMKIMETEHGTFPVVGEDYEISDEEKAKRQAEENFKNLMDGKTVEMSGLAVETNEENNKTASSENEKDSSDYDLKKVETSEDEKEEAIRSDLEKAEAVKNNVAKRVEAVFIRINDGTLDNEDERKRTKKNLERIEKDFGLYKNELKNDGVDIEKLQKDIEEAKKQVANIENSNNAKEIEYTEEQIAEAEKGALNLNEIVIQKEIQSKKESIQEEILAIREAINQSKDSEIKNEAKAKVLAVEGVLDNLKTREDIDELDREMKELGEIMDNIIENSEEGLGDKSAFEGYEFPSDREEAETEENSEEVETQELEISEEAVEGEVLELIEIGEELSEKVNNIKERLRKNIGNKTEEGLILEAQFDEIQSEIAKLNNQVRRGEKTAEELKDEYDFYIKTIKIKEAEIDINWGSAERAKANLVEMNIIYDKEATTQMSKRDIQMLLLSQLHQRDAMMSTRRGVDKLMEQTSEIQRESLEKLQEAQIKAAKEAEENTNEPEQEIKEKKEPWYKKIFKSKKKEEVVEVSESEETETPKEEVAEDVSEESNTEELMKESAFVNMEMPEENNEDEGETIDEIGDRSVFEGIINPIEENVADDETSNEELGEESAFAVEEIELPEDNLEEVEIEDSTEETEEKLKKSVEYLTNNTDKIAKSLLAEELKEVNKDKAGLVNILNKIEGETRVVDLLKEKMGVEAEKFLEEIDPLLDAVQENERLVFKKDIKVKNLVNFIEKSL